MPNRLASIAAALLVGTLCMGGRGSGDAPLDIWAHICSIANGRVTVSAAWAAAAGIPTIACPAAPTAYQSLPSVGTGGDTSVSFKIGYDASQQSLCFVAPGLAQAPVLRVGVGHSLTIGIANTLHDTHLPHARNVNCAINDFGSESSCVADPVFPAAPGSDGPYYPIAANQAHNADGTSNLHVHGLFVAPTLCSDEVLQTAIYPANWLGAAPPLAPCQPQPNELTYTYRLPADHPAGIYWYHTHRHGQAEYQSQMGLVGAIVVEDEGDAWRRSIGVTDEVLLVTDTPLSSCVIDPSCGGDSVRRTRPHRQPDQAEARRLAEAAKAVSSNPATAGGGVTLDPRIDQVHQAGECAQGATGADGGNELWTLRLNGAPVPETPGGFPFDSDLLSKTMQPGQRQIFRLVNASADSFLAPQLVLSQNGVQTVLPLEVFARDGVGLVTETGARRFGYFDVAKTPLILPPASRIEFVVHAPPTGASLYLQSAQVSPGCGGNAYPARRLLWIVTVGTPVDPGAADDRDLLEHTPSLAPYLSTLGDTPALFRTFVLSEYSRGFTYGVTDWKTATPGAGQYDPNETDFYLTEVASTGEGFHPDQTTLKPFSGHNLEPQVVVHLHGRSSVTEDWLIENSTLEIHAFHMHQIHFRDVTTGTKRLLDHPLLDTINVPAAPLVGTVATGYPGAPGFVKLRMTFTTADIGEFVFHCHILEHEDSGMMAKISVVAD